MDQKKTRGIKKRPRWKLAGRKTCALGWLLNWSILLSSTRLLSRQQKQSVHVFCSFPLSPGLCTICIWQHLLSSLTVVPPPQFSPKNTTNSCLRKKPLHQAKAINTHKKGKESHLTRLAVIIIIMWWYNIYKPKKKNQGEKGWGG